MKHHPSENDQKLAVQKMGGSITTRQKEWVLLWGPLILIAVFLLAAYICVPVFNVFHAHEHCIKQAGVAFSAYAAETGGKLPYDTNGFGNALLLLVKGGYFGDTNGQLWYRADYRSRRRWLPFQTGTNNWCAHFRAKV